MKHFYDKFQMLSFMLMALFCFSSCMDDDDHIGYDVKGHWFGDMDMYYNGERAQGSEIEFKSTGWGYDRGTGVEVDYYRFHAVTNYFDWRVSNRVIYLTFDDPNLDCAIVDYSLGYDYFRGYIADYHTLENQTHFSLRNYDRYWDTYGYSSYYDYYVKGTRAEGDSIASDVVPSDSASSAPLSIDSSTETSSYNGIRGIYLKDKD